MEFNDHKIRGKHSERHPGRHYDMRIFFGTGLLVAGLVLILNNFKLIPPEIKEYIFKWEMILILIGVMHLFSRRNIIVGLILICLGGFFLIPDVFDVPDFHHMFWPVIFIALGLIILFKSRHFIGKGKYSVKDGDDIIDDMAIFGGSERRITSKNLKGGRITSIIGGFADKRTRIPEDGVSDGRKLIIKGVVIFGGGELRSI